MGSKTTGVLKATYVVEKKNESFFNGRLIQVTNDGEYIFCQCAYSVNIVQLSTGSTIRKIEDEEDEVVSFSLSPNNLAFAIGFNSSTVKHFAYKGADCEPSLLTSFKSYHRGPVLTMSWDASSTLLATGSSDSTARVWDLKQKFCTHSLKGAEGVFRVLLFNNNLHKRPWIFGAVDDVIYIWLLEASSSKLISKLDGHTSAVTGMQISHSEDQLISCGLDKVVILWDLNTFTSQKVFPLFESVCGIILKPKDIIFPGVSQEKDYENCVFAIGNKGIPFVMDVETGRRLWSGSEVLVQAAEKEVLLINQVLFVPSLKSILLTTYEHNIIFLHWDTMQVWKQMIGYNDEILDAIFLGETNNHIAVATNSALIRIYNNVNLNCKLISGHTGYILALARHPTVNTVFGSSGHDNTARIWKLRESDGSAICLAVAVGHSHSVGSLVLTHGRLVTGSKDTCIKSYPISSEILSSNTEKECSIFNLSSAQTQRAHDKDINCICASKNHTLVATASQDKVAKIWNANTLDLLGQLKGHKKGLWCVQFSPTDRLIATGGADGTIKIWTIDDYCNVATLEGHEVSVLRLCWVSEGLQILSSGSDGLLKLWGVKKKLCINTFDEHNDKVWSLAIAEDGKRVVTGGLDSTIIWWKDATEEEELKKKEERDRTVQEEQTLLNLCQKKKWSKALRFAIRLNQPYRGLRILKELLDESPSQLHRVLNRLRDDELSTLIEFAVQWNTKTKDVREAQSIISYVFKERLPEEIEALPDWQTSLEGLLPYTEKHFKRLAALHQSASILSYISSQSSLGVRLESCDLQKKPDDEVALLLSIENVKEEDEHRNLITDKVTENPTNPIDCIEDTQPDYVMENVTSEESDVESDIERAREESGESDQEEFY